MGTKSEQLHAKAMLFTPGNQSNRGVPPGETPPYIVKGSGARVWDVDGKEYIDYMAGAGPGILGHGNREYLESLKNQIAALYYITAQAMQTPAIVELSEKIHHLVACAEMVRFGMTGSEAVQLAIRLARAYTGKPYIIRFDGHYHGGMDNILGGLVSDDPINNPFTTDKPGDKNGTAGRDPAAFLNSFKIPWNDSVLLEKVLQKWGDRVAMVIMEPINVNGGSCPPRAGYLEKVRQLCDQYGVVLCFDEIITGFRVALNCAQGILGVTPDLATFGKAVSGGIPFSVVAGKKEIMNLLQTGGVAGCGTFNGHPLGVNGALTTLKILESNDGAIYKHIDMCQAKLKQGIKEICKRANRPCIVQGPRGVFSFQFTDHDMDVFYTSAEMNKANIGHLIEFRRLLAEEGILMMWNGRWYFSAGLTLNDIDITLEKFEKAIQRL